MKGVDDLIALRKSRKVPAAGVLLRLTDDPVEPMGVSPAWLTAGVSERLDRADLRCVMGLPVVVHGPYLSADAVRLACECVAKAKARSVLGFATDAPELNPERMVFAQGDFDWLR